MKLTIKQLKQLIKEQVEEGFADGLAVERDHNAINKSSLELSLRGLVWEIVTLAKHMGDRADPSRILENPRVKAEIEKILADFDTDR